MIDRQLGAYRILRELGRGGMGVVYAAEHTLIGRRAAVKVIHTVLSAREEVVQRFFNEARAAASIEDPGIVQVLDFGYDNGAAYLVMELLAGETLAARLKDQARLPPAEALRITRQVAATLSHAHAANIVHRDLKPENIFMVRDVEVPGGERPKVLDFGIAKLLQDPNSTVATGTGEVLGTPMYMSPEQCSGAGAVDHRADIYSLGCVLFRLLTGRPPFEARGMGDMIALHLREPPIAPSVVVPGLSAELDALVLRCLEKDPDARFQTMSELIEAIGTIGNPGTPRGDTPRPRTIAAEPVTPSMARGETLPAADSRLGETPSTPARRRPLGLVAGGLVIAAIGGYLLVRAWSSSSPSANAPPATDAALVAPVIVDAPVETAIDASVADGPAADAAAATAPLDGGRVRTPDHRPRDAGATPLPHDASTRVNVDLDNDGIPDRR